MNKPHVLPGAELGVGDIDERRSANNFTQRLPDPDVCLIIGEVAIEYLIVHGHGAIAGDGETPYELFQVRAMVLVMAVRDVHRAPAIFARRTLAVEP